MELIDRLKEVLKEEFNICSDEELLEAVQSMPELDLGIFVTPLKGDNNAKSACSATETTWQQTSSRARVVLIQSSSRA